VLEKKNKMCTPRSQRLSLRNTDLQHDDIFKTVLLPIVVLHKIHNISNTETRSIFGAYLEIIKTELKCNVTVTVLTPLRGEPHELV
jgi:hypothetical protein